MLAVVIFTSQLKTGFVISVSFWNARELHPVLKSPPVGDLVSLKVSPPMNPYDSVLIASIFVISDLVQQSPSGFF
jgi:hypothetical protein